MLGLAILFIFGVYLAVSIFATWYVMAWARESGRRAWLWGCIAGFAMYNLLFWDLIPTLIMHKYYCSTQAGFWPYKSFEQWDAENPGVAQTLNSKIEPIEAVRNSVVRPENARRTWYNVRFYRDTLTSDKVTSIRLVEDQYIDVETQETIARSVNFFRGFPDSALALGGSPEEIRQSLVLGWGNRQCEIAGKPVREAFDAYIYNFWKSGEVK